MDYLLIFIMGTCIGSFFCLVAIRGLQNESIITPSSYCEFCKKPLTWLEKIPLLSYLLLGGKSICCHQPISWKYPFWELISGSIFLILYEKSENIIGDLGMVLPLTIIAMEDSISFSFRSKWLILLLVGAVFKLILSQNAILISIVAFVCTMILFQAILYISPQGMGRGDMYVASILTIGLGNKSFWMLCISFIMAGMVASIKLLRGSSKRDKLALTPFFLFAILGMMGAGL